MQEESLQRFLKALDDIKEEDVEIFSSYLYPQVKRVSTAFQEEYRQLAEKLNTEQDRRNFQTVQTELAEEVLYHVMELLDGYGALDSGVDLVERKTQRAINRGVQLHDRIQGVFEQTKETNK